jgi:hypothetical protein
MVSYQLRQSEEYTRDYFTLYCLRKSGLVNYYMGRLLMEKGLGESER